MVMTYYSLYMSSTRSEYFSRITFLFILRVGVNSPPGMLRSTGRMRNFYKGEENSSKTKDAKY